MKKIKAGVKAFFIFEKVSKILILGKGKEDRRTLSFNICEVWID